MTISVTCAGQYWVELSGRKMHVNGRKVNIFAYLNYLLLSNALASCSWGGEAVSRSYFPYHSVPKINSSHGIRFNQTAIPTRGAMLLYLDPLEMPTFRIENKLIRRAIRRPFRNQTLLNLKCRNFSTLNLLTISI